MKNYSVIFSDKRTGNILAISIIFFFLFLSLIRLFPFENHLSSILNEGKDDWFLYARFALDIKQNGILMSSVNGVYNLPSGFLYNYFVALCFFVFGENLVPVYIIQSTLLGFSIAFIYWAFRDKMKPRTGILFLITMFIFALVDVSRYYSFRLLSENLALFTIAVFFYCFIKGIEKNKLALFISAAVFLGFSILIRPNVFPFGIALNIILLFYFLKQKKKELLKSFLFLLFFGLSMSLLAIRNYLICGKWVFLPYKGSLLQYIASEDHIIPSSVKLSGLNSPQISTTGYIISYAEYIWQQPLLFFSFYIKKLMFCFGFLSFLEPSYNWRFHWILMWAAYFAYLFFSVKRKFRFEIWEMVTHLFILFYYSALILVTPIGSYGFRMLIPCTFIVLAFAFMVLDKRKKEDALNVQ